MCGIIGFEPVNKKSFSRNFEFLEKCLMISSRRGSDASGIFFLFKKKNEVKYVIIRSQNSPKITLKKKEVFNKVKFFFENEYDLYYVIAHTRLSTNGESTKNENNQPLINEQQNQILVFNGIVTNYEKIILKQKLKLSTQNDGEIFFHMSNHEIKDKVDGSYSVITIKNEKNELNLNFFSNTGSIYFLKKSDSFRNIILSEESFFKKLGLKNYIKPKINHFYKLRLIDLRKKIILKEYLNIENNSSQNVKVFNISNPKISKECNNLLKKRTEYILNKIKRCTNCILPNTHPFIFFDEKGVCNFCNNFVQVKPKGLSSLEKEINITKKKQKKDNKVLLGLSGGRDSSYALHFLVNELNIKPITYYYDWGLNTEIARKNVAIMTGSLGIENIMIAADIRLKRNNVKKNILAWLKSPHLGMVPLFMAGDKDFISNSQIVKNELNSDIEIFAFNLHEKTQFKEEFTNFRMWEDQGSSKNYGEQLKLSSQIKMLFFYGSQFLKNPRYLNSSLIDSFKGFFNYYHSGTSYIQFFEYIEWNEKIINNTLIDKYGWITAQDTSTTWRIGDGTSAFYNLIYFLFAGFTENDVLRSNLIRQKHLSRSEALKMTLSDNQIRFPTLDWYFKLFDLDLEIILKQLIKLSRNYGVI